MTNGDETNQENHEPYRLLVRGLGSRISETVRDSWKELEEYKGDGEALHAIESALRITLENAGDETFPGGEIPRIDITESTGGMSSLDIMRGESQEVNSIEPGDDLVVMYKNIHFYTAGVARIKLTINSSDGRPVFLDLGGVHESQEEEVLLPISVLDRPTVQVYKELSKIRAHLEGEKND